MSSYCNVFVASIECHVSLISVRRADTNLLHSCGFFGNLGTAKDFSSFLMPYVMESALLSQTGVLCEVPIWQAGCDNEAQRIKKVIQVRRRAFDVALMQDRGAAKSTVNTAGLSSYLSCELCIVPSVKMGQDGTTTGNCALYFYVIYM